ncbi:hypothetical protein LOK49_LG03G02742 [Camellia lanceoleosa]|uniref:Uncharacterized protein n=1 Tax=Camellia lanceoleosa TaxID=1840588 RepID=A0ACC0IEN6_9ERIC|nr:hypothetical protein LOK49_LG03G02742 [Camellia lanceoleosa]
MKGVNLGFGEKEEEFRSWFCNGSWSCSGCVGLLGAAGRCWLGASLGRRVFSAWRGVGSRDVGGVGCVSRRGGVDCSRGECRRRKGREGEAVGKASEGLEEYRSRGGGVGGTSFKQAFEVPFTTIYKKILFEDLLRLFPVASSPKSASLSFPTSRFILPAAEILAKQGISAEVINLRSIRPVDRTTINASVRNTSRLVTVEEGCPQHGVVAEICASVIEESFIEKSFMYRDALSGKAFTAKRIQVLELVGKETMDLLITETGIEVDKKGAQAQDDDDQLFEEVTFDRCFYIYGGPEQLEITFFIFLVECLSIQCHLE